MSKYYRASRGNYKCTTSLPSDAFDSVKEYAANHGLSLSGAIHHLIRTHPEINLGAIK